MKIITLPRQAGKTTELIKLCAEEKAYIVCPTLSDCENIFALSKKLDINIPFPISWHEFISKRYHAPGIKKFLIDDLDRCIQMLSSLPIKAVSLNLDD